MDLAVFGASFASGFGSGKENDNNYNAAYPRLVANKLNVDNFYNFSIPARSISSLKDDIIDFTENYIQVNKSTENLVVLGELTDPKYITVPIVKGTDNNIYKPTVLLTRKGKTAGDFSYLYSRVIDYSKMINDTSEVYDSHLLNRTEEKIIITPEAAEYVKKYVKDKLHNMKSPLVESYQVYKDSFDSLCVVIDYLRKREVRYVLVWIFAAATYAERQFRIIDRARFDSYFDSRLVDPKTASLAKLISTDTDLVGQFDLHPSEAGHEFIADYLYKYITQFNILEDITYERPIE